MEEENRFDLDLELFGDPPPFSPNLEFASSNGKSHTVEPFTPDSHTFENSNIGSFQSSPKPPDQSQQQLMYYDQY